MQPPRLDDQLCFALYAASRAMVRSYGPLLKELGLTYPQLLVMMVLWEQDDLSVSQLGERLRLDSGTLTPLLKRMEKQGLVSRQRDPADERRVRVTLTQQGRDLSGPASRLHHALFCRLQELSGDSGASEVTGLRDALHALTEALGDAE